MNVAGKVIIDVIQELLGRGIRIFPETYYQFLEHLKERERAHKLCLLPSPRFELYHMRLARKSRFHLARKIA